MNSIPVIVRFELAVLETLMVVALAAFGGVAQLAGRVA
jgi:hypothetical protein